MLQCHAESPSPRDVTIPGVQEAYPATEQVAPRQRPSLRETSEPEKQLEDPAGSGVRQEENASFLLEAWQRVYEGLSEEEIAEIEAIALNRSRSRARLEAVNRYAIDPERSLRPNEMALQGGAGNQRESPPILPPDGPEPLLPLQ